MATVRISLLAFLVVGAGCGGEGDDNTLPPSGDSDPGAVNYTYDPLTDPDYDPVMIYHRPFDLLVPASYHGQLMPLVVALHGLGGTGPDYAGPGGYSELAEAAERRGFFLAYPSGLLYTASSPLMSPQFNAWNASCCGALDQAIANSSFVVDPAPADDVTYLQAVIADVRSRYHVDPQRIYFQGHSNGAFMAYQAACQSAHVVAGVAALAGTFFSGEEIQCNPTAPLAVHHIHGNADDTVLYTGGTWGAAGVLTIDHIGARETIDAWIGKNGCSTTATTDTFDAVSNLPADETAIERFGGCNGHAAVELWTMDGGVHMPRLTRGYRDAMLDFLFAHPKQL